jgi:hypothetical protein
LPTDGAVRLQTLHAFFAAGNGRRVMAGYRDVFADR